MADILTYDIAALAVDFVNARIAEDEQIAHTFGVPRRILRDIEAKRRRIARWRYIDSLIPGSDGAVRNDLLSVRRAYVLAITDDASVYADHPDFRIEWLETIDHGEPGVQPAGGAKTSNEQLIRERIAAEIEAVAELRATADHKPGSIFAERQRGERAGLIAARDIALGVLNRDGSVIR